MRLAEWVVSETFRHYPQNKVTSHVGQASACGVASARLPQVPATRSSGTEVLPSLYSTNLSRLIDAPVARFSPTKKPRPRRRIGLPKLKQPFRYFEPSLIRRMCAVC